MYKPPNSTSGFTSCGLSVSGRFLLAGSDDNSIHVWDTMKVQHNGKFYNQQDVYEYFPNLIAFTIQNFSTSIILFLQNYVKIQICLIMQFQIKK